MFEDLYREYYNIHYLQERYDNLGFIYPCNDGDINFAEVDLEVEEC